MHELKIMRLARVYLSCGGTIFRIAENRACTVGSTGRCLTRVLAGSFSRQLPSFQFAAGRIGRGSKLPPQFGQTLKSTCSTQSAQNVHSYEQMRASSESGGKGLSQFSQVGLSSSIFVPFQVMASGRGHRAPATLRRLLYSANTSPEPPISFGRSFIFGSPSFIGSFVSW